MLSNGRPYYFREFDLELDMASVWWVLTADGRTPDFLLVREEEGVAGIGVWDRIGR